MSHICWVFKKRLFFYKSFDLKLGVCIVESLLFSWLTVSCVTWETVAFHDLLFKTYIFWLLHWKCITKKALPPNYVHLEALRSVADKSNVLQFRTVKYSQHNCKYIINQFQLSPIMYLIFLFCLVNWLWSYSFHLF